MDFWVVLPVHSSSQDSSQESETRSSSGQLLTAQQSEDELTEDEESAVERLLKAQHEVQSDSGTGEYPWFSFVDSSSTAKFLSASFSILSVLIDELGKTTFKAVLQPKISMAAIFLAAKTKNEYRLVEHIIKTAHLADPPRPGLDVKSEFYNNLKKEIISIERLLLQILGFQVDVELPHPDVIEICQKLKGIDLLPGSYQESLSSGNCKHYGNNHVLVAQASDCGLCLCQLGSQVGTDTGSE